MRARAVVAFTTALIAMLCAGLWLGGHPGKLPKFVRGPFVDSSAGLTAEATELIEDNYYRSVDQRELGNSSLQGMVRGLRQRFHDRFSEYFSKENLERFNEEISGRFSGIGLSVTQVERGLRAERVFAGSPAARAGIEPGDVVVSVDGESIAGVSSEVATAKIKGPEGTDVVVGVLDPKSGKVRDVRLTRAQVSLPITTTKVKTVNGRKLGYVRLVTFSEGAHAALREAVEKVEREGAEGIVLDLRGNGGGLLDEAVLSASVFMPKGKLVVSTDSRTQGHSAYRTVGGNLPRRPVVVLIDRNTASAAEILTAALADDIGAPVVGTRSYGKGVFQQEVGLSNGGALKLTIGEYFTPKGVNLAGKGIHPDVPARDDPQTKADEGMQRALEVLAHQQG
ncbi:MAG TPA: S41 family peptidase [Solirubrobacterales bacterium]|nr:S41 family peptidase [Solirubrobacterales bacterium]